ERGVAIHDVIEGQFLALQLTSVSDAGFADLRLPVKSSGLVRVLPVPQVLGFDILQVQGLAEKGPLPSFPDAPEVISDRAIIARGEAKRLLRQGELVLGRERAARAQRV